MGLELGLASPGLGQQELLCLVPLFPRGNLHLGAASDSLSLAETMSEQLQKSSGRAGGVQADL